MLPPRKREHSSSISSDSQPLAVPRRELEAEARRVWQPVTIFLSLRPFPSSSRALRLSRRNLARKKLLTDTHLRSFLRPRLRTLARRGAARPPGGELRAVLDAIALSGMGNASCQSPGAPNELQYFILTPVHAQRCLALPPRRRGLIAFNSLLVHWRNGRDRATRVRAAVTLRPVSFFLRVPSVAVATGGISALSLSLSLDSFVPIRYIRTSPRCRDYYRSSFFPSSRQRRRRPTR